jgi:NADH-quinone oxidoreductase subunit D
VGSAVRVLVGSLATGMLPTADAAPPAGTLLLDLGPDHPSGAGLLELRLWVEDEQIQSARVIVGAMHRGAEKLFEVRDYRQIVMLADRHDWQAPFAGELGVVLACEELLGLEIPLRARWLRTLLAEHTRIASHLGFLGYLPFRLDLPHRGGALRERLRRQLEDLTGNRVHPMINRIGGLAADADAGWLANEVAVCHDAAEWAAEMLILGDTARFRDEAAGLAPLDAETVASYGVSGPAARASGVDLDLRLHAPYLSYGELSALIAVPGFSANGDARARIVLLAYEIEASAALVRACAERLADLPGPVAERLGKIIKLPEGETYVATEAPLGMAGVHLVSRGEKTPWRLRLRTASFSNIAALEAVLPGVPVTRLETALASMGYVVGDIDK